MGIRSDLLFAGLAIGALVLFKNQIGSAFASAGTAAGSAISGGLASFAGSITSAFTPEIPPFENTFTQETNAPDFPTEQPLPPVCECGTTIVQDASGNVSQTCIACAPPAAMPPAADPFDFAAFFAGLFPPAAAESIPSDPIITSTPSPTGTDFSVELFEGGLGGNISGDPVFSVDGFTITAQSSLNDIINAFGISASQATNLKFEAGF